MFPSALPKTALIYQDTPVSYETLLRNIEAYASLAPMKPGERAVIFSKNRPEWIYAFYAVWLREGICVPADAAMPVPDLSFVIHDCRPSRLFCSEADTAAVSEALATVQVRPEIMVFERINRVLRFREIRKSVRPTEKPGATAVILYTSGTTGRPKGVMLSYDNLVSNIEAVEASRLVTREDRVFSPLPFHHIFPLQAEVTLPLYLGSTVIMPSGLEPRDILHALQTHRPTVVIGVPRLYEHFRHSILDQINQRATARRLFTLARRIHRLGFSRHLFAGVQQRFGGRIRVCISGGAKLDPAVAADLRALGFKMLEGYGTTETSPLIAVNPERKIRLGSVGTPISANRVKLVEGEIVVKGRNVMQGYYRRPAATARALRDGWYYTGDLGEFGPGGYLYIRGRKDEMIVLPGGQNVSPEDIENRLQALSPLVKEAAVTLDQGRLTALLYPGAPSPDAPSPSELRERIKWQVIEPYNRGVAEEKKILNVRLVREPFQRTRLGKLRRFALAGALRESQAEDVGAAEPDFPEYRFLRDFLAKLRSIPVKPWHHLESDVGLDSLDKAELSAFFADRFGLELSANTLREHATVARLADYARERKTRLQVVETGWPKILAETRPAENTRQTAVRLRKALKNLLARYFELEYGGSENLGQPPFIFAANHQSYLDGPVIAAGLPADVLDRTVFVMKKGIFASRLAGLVARGSRITVDPDKDLKSSLQRIASVLKAGWNVLIFPEGRRSRDGRIAPFKKAFAILSKELGVPVIPTAVQGSYRLMPYGRFWPRRGKIRVDFLQPFTPAREDYADFAGRVEVLIKSRVEK